ncbi:PadR family transcriptional regulator [Deinococcus sp. QL22]|uniref:PadR family transcriptional regulator n=1 Tax=Deinococcus sp. QL22 TaxID=2939437 RepID=UPI002016FCC0|nr:PadR family transcriptional regulator [Deinococcus sp. QL22]UQN08197.1 PadR family transcriptional regulator [Deinococcus sp. QL22]
MSHPPSSPPGIIPPRSDLPAGPVLWVHSTHTRAVLQTLLHRHPAPMHGYDLSKATDLKSGTLYPILKRLHEQGHLNADWEASPHPGKPPRHIYTLTASGISLARETPEWATKGIKGVLI